MTDSNFRTYIADTYLHLARKYNGEWVPADGSLSMILSEWRTQAYRSLVLDKLSHL